MIFIFLLNMAAATPTAVDGYSCEITVIAKDLPAPGYASIKLQRPAKSSQSHGGAPYEFAVGTHKIGILADGRWRGLIWQHDGKDVAQVLTAGTEQILGNQVMILYNPADTGEMVNLVCDPIKDIFPTE